MQHDAINSALTQINKPQDDGTETAAPDELAHAYLKHHFYKNLCRNFSGQLD